MFVMHVALQGCLRAHTIEYGITADTGGHIRYLLQLVDASSRDPAIDRIDIVTRAFEADFTPHSYAPGIEYVNPKVRIVRLATASPQYLAKEALAAELPSFTRALSGYIDEHERTPDVLHAHYADAARIAADIETRHAIPFVFTAHSLGRTKRRCQRRCGPLSAAEHAALAHRIDCEERALEQASLVIASSRDEAEAQYAHYRAFEPGKIRVLAPGADLQAFAGARTTGHVRDTLARFLAEPDKPALLAIARPVTRKNLAALVRAYGQSPALQARANLVVLAGTRERLDRLEPELAANLRELLTLIDRYDLYGRIAYPKQHRPADIAAYYAWARDRRGLFVNPAFDEPFGLTLIEAAAVGLPVIATDRGGPNDIVAQCDNGVLVDTGSKNAPADAIAKAALSLLADDDAWQRYADNGVRAARAFDWRVHAGRYHGFLQRLLAGPQPKHQETSAMLVCDIDATLTGSQHAITAFNQWLASVPTTVFGVATGRSLHSALLVLEAAGIAPPQFLITSVGAEIYYLADDGISYRADQDWQKQTDTGWHRAAIADALQGFDRLTLQPPLEQRGHKLSYTSDRRPAVAEELRAHLRSRGLACNVVYSHQRYIDILPRAVSKGAAVEQVRARYGLAPERVYVAGDSGNDAAMLAAYRQAILVANHQDGLAERAELAHAYISARPHAAGVIEGVQVWQERALHVS